MREPGRLDELWGCLRGNDPLVRMRAADALEKISRVLPDLFEPYKQALLTAQFEDGSAEVRWHLIAITSRLAFQPHDAVHFFAYLDHCLRHNSSRIVKVTALQAAYDLSANFPQLNAEYKKMLSFARSSTWPSLIARAAKLIAKGG